MNIFNNAFYACSERGNRERNLAVLNTDDRLENLPGFIPKFKPTVTLTTKNLKSKVEISIKDNGSGIPDKIKDKIFQPFFTTKPTGQGTGLGLSLAYDIVKAHGGSLSVQSSQANGTEFVISLPMN